MFSVGIGDHEQQWWESVMGTCHKCFSHDKSRCPNFRKRPPCDTPHLNTSRLLFLLLSCLPAMFKTHLLTKKNHQHVMLTVGCCSCFTIKSSQWSAGVKAFILKRWQEVFRLCQLKLMCSFKLWLISEFAAVSKKTNSDDCNDLILTVGVILLWRCAYLLSPSLQYSC